MLSVDAPAFAAVSTLPRPSSPSRTAVSALKEKPERAALVLRLTRDGRPREALSLFRDAVAAGVLHEPDDLPVATVLSCCSSLGAVLSGRELHGYMMRRAGVKPPTCSSESSLVGFYAKCGFLAHARKVFDQMAERDTVAWTVMLKAYADREGCDREMIHLFADMLRENIPPNCHTLSVMLSNSTIEHGKQLHACIVKRSLDSDAFVGSSLVDVYARSGNLDLAQMVFDRIPLKDVVCYNCLISGYGRTGIIEHLVSLYVQMCSAELVPNQSTSVGLLSGCAYSGSINFSKQFHAQVVVRGFLFDEAVQGAIIDMYAKCGDIEAARAAFDTANAKQNAAIWNIIICGYGKHGRTEEALGVFNLMESASVHPDYITFICLLSACSHSGLIDEGLRLFSLMQDCYGIRAREEHYSCMVDLYGRAGMVQKAYELISKSRCNFVPSLWGALLSASRVHGDANIGEIAAGKLFELEPESSGSYVALANIYAAGGQWEEANAIRKWMCDRNIQKDTGYSWIEVGGMVHKFRAGGGDEDPTCMEEDHLGTCDHLFDDLSIGINIFVRTACIGSTLCLEVVHWNLEKKAGGISFSHFLSEYMPWQKQRTTKQTPCKLLDRRRLLVHQIEERIMWSRRTRSMTCSGCRVQLCVPPHAQSIRCAVCGAVTLVGGSQDTLRQAMGFLRSMVTNISNGNSSFANSSSGLNGYSYPTANLPFPRVHGKKRAVLVGITYTGRRYELKGTVNDVNCMRYLLTEKFGFPEDCILTLTELERDPRRIPTKENLRAAMRWLVEGCKAGDSLVFHFSGHGVQKLDLNGEELDGYNEALCPLDFEAQGTIVDDEVNNILVRPLRPGVKLHALVDACHSGTILDLPYHCRLSRAGYYQWQNHMPQNTYKGTTGGLAILISGCDDDQTSADTTSFAGSTSTGAMTYSFIKAVENEPGTTYGNLLMAMRSVIREGSNTGIRLNGPIASLMRRVFNFGFKQEPQLSSSEMFDIYRKPFLL